MKITPFSSTLDSIRMNNIANLRISSWNSATG